jgi:hypothetical protein
MQAISLRKPTEKVSAPQILVRPLYRKDNPIKPVAYQTIDFVPGAVIDRNGKRYQLQPNGSQRRMK